MEVFGGGVAELEVWLTRHILVVSIAFCLGFAGIAALCEMRNGREAPHIVGTVLKVAGATLSILTAFRLLLPFVVRGCMGTGEAAFPPVPPCAGAVTCKELEEFGQTFVRATVPASTGLGTATLGALLGSIAFFCATWKPVLFGRRAGTVYARLARNLKRGLKQKGWTNEDAASATGVQRLEAILQGTADPTLRELTLIADKLDKDPVDLLKP